MDAFVSEDNSLPCLPAAIAAKSAIAAWTDLVTEAQALTRLAKAFDQHADMVGAVRDIAKTANLAPARPFSDRNRDRRLVHIQADKNGIVHQVRPRPFLRLGVGQLWDGPPAASDGGHKVLARLIETS